MSRRRPSADSLPFDTLRLEGSLFVPQLLERAAHGEASHQQESDYDIPKGLKLHEEYGRAYRIALALWQDFAPAMLRKDLDATRATIAFTSDFFRDALGYGDLTLASGPVRTDAAIEREFPVTAFAAGGRVPVIIAPHTLDLDTPDTRFAILGSGSRKKSAHQLAQEFLNASRDCLWAFVTNGRALRLLRDADTLTRPNFLEFDLDTILRQGEDRYADFSALWRMLHASRAGSGAVPTDCVWEQWKSAGHAEGTRIRKGLSDGVTQTLLKLGNGFLAHTDNAALRQRLHEGELSREDYFQQLLRLVYRWLFLFCAEERDLLHPPMPEDPGRVDAARSARHAYAEGYSMRRLRSRCLRQFAHDSHGDLWVANRIVFRSLGRGEPRLDLPALGGLFSADQCPDLDGSALGNRDLLAAMRELRWFFDRKSGQRSAVDYRNMGTEELGSVYESLLELVPQLDLLARQFGFAGITDDSSTSGNARKTSGSYYTPDSLVQELIKSALDPVIRQRLAEARALAPLAWTAVVAEMATDPAKHGYVRAFLEKHAGVPATAPLDALGRAWDAMPAHERENPLCAEALLALAVCDPSCGSGHFLLAAARRLAERLAELRAPEGAVRPDDYRHALREVASRCLYGVDLNPMAVELCRVALWLETVDPGKPLGFLDHHIRCGNSLLGTTPELIAAGIPDGAFNAIEGDDKAACAELKKRNKKEREGFGPLFEKEEQSIRDSLRRAASRIEFMDDEDPEALHRKEEAFERNEMSTESRHAKLLADLWCAAFVIKKHYPVTDGQADTDASSETTLPPLVGGELLHTQEDLFGQNETTPVRKAASKRQPSPKTQDQGTPLGITTAQLRDFVQGKPLPEEVRNEVDALASNYRFFHWHLAFPQVFEKGGFDVMLGNPPWERPKPEPAKYFAASRPDITEAQTSAVRDKLLVKLQKESPEVFAEWAEYERFVLGCVHFQTGSGVFPLSAVGKFNLGNTFIERSRQLLNMRGRCGLMNVSGLATDDSGKDLIADLMRSQTLVSFYDFENREGLFPAIHRSYKFSAVTVAGSTDSGAPKADFVFFAQTVEDLNDSERHISFSSDDIQLLNPISGNCPIFRERRQAELVKAIYRRAELRKPPNQVLWEWDAEPTFLFVMSDHSDLFATREELELANFNLDSITPEVDGERRLPLYESKMFHQFEHRWCSLDTAGTQHDFDTSTLANPASIAIPRYWMRASDTTRKLGALPHQWLVAVREVTNATNERTTIAATLPKYPVGHNAQVFVFNSCASEAASFVACLNSFVFDFAARTKIGGSHLSSFILRQLPILPSRMFTSGCEWVGGLVETLRDWLLSRVLELTYTAWDLEPFAQDCGWPGPPYRWDEERRFLLRCEVDAAFFHLYGLNREDTAYVLDTFPIVKRKDEAKHGHYCTKDTILQIYDSLVEAIATGIPYKTLLDPPPGSFRVAHLPRLPSTPRLPLAQARSYWLEFIGTTSRLAGEEFTFDLLWTAYLSLLDLATHAGDAAATLGKDAEVWLDSVKAEPLTAGVFPNLLESLNADGFLTVDPEQGRLRLSPDLPYTPDPWRCYDVAAVLTLLQARPAALEFTSTTTASTPDQTRYDSLAKRFA